jgi:putative membrane protein
VTSHRVTEEASPASALYASGVGRVPLSRLATFAATPDQLVPFGIVAGGAVLAWLCRDFPADLPFWAPWEFSWVEFLAAALGFWWYARGVALTKAPERPSAWRHASFAIGVVSIYAVLQTHYDYMAQHMFFLNRLQHLIMHHLGPFLVALSWPGASIRRAMPAPLGRLVDDRRVLRVLGWVQQPIIGAPLFVGLIDLWLIPAVHFQAMIDHRLYAVMNYSMVADGLLFWCLVLDPRSSPPARFSFAVRMITVVAVMFPQIIVGSYIAFAGRDLYTFYDLCGRLFPSMGALNDQHLGGLIVWIPASMMSSAAFMLVLNNLRRHEESVPLPELSEEQRRVVVLSSRWTGR